MKCAHCHDNPKTKFPDHINEDDLEFYHDGLLKCHGPKITQGILDLYLVYCELGKMVLCVNCANKFIAERRALLKKYGGK